MVVFLQIFTAVLVAWLQMPALLKLSFVPSFFRLPSMHKMQGLFYRGNLLYFCGQEHNIYQI